LQKWQVKAWRSVRAGGVGWRISKDVFKRLFYRGTDPVGIAAIFLLGWCFLHRPVP
jgi:hypothetical protein